MGGIVGGPRTYDGPGMPGSGWLPWKCPACAAENSGSIDDGCVHCGSGSAKPRHVGHAPPTEDLHLTPAFAAVKQDMDRALDVYAAAGAWEAAHTDAGLSEAFVAGYQLAMQEAKAHTMQAPPVTADVAALAPEGKARRTIIAALEIFKDQILRDAADEIASGEWCSVEETDALIHQLKTEEESER